VEAASVVITGSTVGFSVPIGNMLDYSTRKVEASVLIAISRSFELDAKYLVHFCGIPNPSVLFASTHAVFRTRINSSPISVSLTRGVA
jgi:hypothetical protein